MNAFDVPPGEDGTIDVDGRPVTGRDPAHHPLQFLHDFSYAGYRYGSAIPPLSSSCLDRGSRVFDVTDHGCTPSPGPRDGSAGDCRAGIQSAIDAAARAGGGIVFLPPGEYTVTTEDNDASLVVGASNIVLCGAGSDQTLLKIDPRKSSGSVCKKNSASADVSLSHRDFCYVQSTAISLGSRAERYAWFDVDDASSTEIVQDEPLPTRRVRVADASGFMPGDEVVVQGFRTAAFKEEHDMADPDEGWKDGGAYVFRRTIVGVSGDVLTLDVPTRYRIRTSDDARVARLAPGLEGVREVGLEGLSIGSIRHPAPWDVAACAQAEGTSDPEECAMLENADGSPKYPAMLEMRRSELISVANVRDGWIHDVHTYLPAENAAVPDEVEATPDEPVFVEYLNLGVVVSHSRQVTVSHVELENAQVDRGNHSGYALQLSLTNEVLVDAMRFERVKKGVTFNHGGTSGNVVRGTVYRRIYDYENDFHSMLSMANLIEGERIEGTFWEAAVRPLGSTRHGHGTTQSVFWNLEGASAPSIDSLNWDRDEDGDGEIDPDGSPDFGLVVSNQFGWGYVIGTWGAFPEVIAARLPNRSYDADPTDTRPTIAPRDHVEGAGYDRDPRFGGATMYPPSLYAAQLFLRTCGRQQGCP